MNLREFVYRLIKSFKVNKKDYEKTPLRTRVRMYVKAIDRRAKGNLSYFRLNGIVLNKFGFNLGDIHIFEEDVKKLRRYKTVRQSKKDLNY
jgi:hypothetical protein